MYTHFPAPNSCGKKKSLYDWIIIAVIYYVIGLATVLLTLFDGLYSFSFLKQPCRTSHHAIFQDNNRYVYMDNNILILKSL